VLVSARPSDTGIRRGQGNRVSGRNRLNARSQRCPRVSQAESPMAMAGSSESQSISAMSAAHNPNNACRSVPPKSRTTRPAARTHRANPSPPKGSAFTRNAGAVGNQSTALQVPDSAAISHGCHSSGAAFATGSPGYACSSTGHGGGHCGEPKVRVQCLSIAFSGFCVVHPRPIGRCSDPGSLGAW
jgi:hypothetical protein